MKKAFLAFLVDPEVHIRVPEKKFQPTASHIFGFLFNMLKTVLAGQIDFALFSKPHVFRTLYKRKVNIQSTETLLFLLVLKISRVPLLRACLPPQEPCPMPVATMAVWWSVQLWDKPSY